MHQYDVQKCLSYPMGITQTGSANQLILENDNNKYTYNIQQTMYIK